jgi:DNA-binding transcriptional MerR regulator
MSNEALTVGELADSAGVSRRAIRFYVQRGLLPPPEGKGRGSIYGLEHLQRIRRIQSLQAAGHSLEEIAKLLELTPAPEQADSGVGLNRTTQQESVNPLGDARKSVRLWTRFRIGDGIEIHLDATQYSLPVEKLIALRDAIREIVEDD